MLLVNSFAVRKFLYLAVVLLLAGFLVVGCSSNEEIEISNSNKIADETVDEIESEGCEQDTLLSSAPKLSVSEISSNIENSEYLDGIHTRSNVSCQDCHGEIDNSENIQIPDDNTCLQCHGGTYEVLAKKLQEKDEWKQYNPHNSPHGQESCISCHKVHQSFEFSCKLCHSVPTPERFK